MLSKYFPANLISFPLIPKHIQPIYVSLRPIYALDSFTASFQLRKMANTVWVFFGRSTQFLGLSERFICRLVTQGLSRAHLWHFLWRAPMACGTSMWQHMAMARESTFRLIFFPSSRKLLPFFLMCRFLQTFLELKIFDDNFHVFNLNNVFFQFLALFLFV